MTEVIMLLILTVLCLFIWIMLYFVLNRYVQEQLPADKQQAPTTLGLLGFNSVGMLYRSRVTAIDEETTDHSLRINQKGPKKTKIQQILADRREKKLALGLKSKSTNDAKGDHIAIKETEDETEESIEFKID